MAIIKRKNYKKIALVLSLCVILAWSFMGTGASLAWFVDTDEGTTNIFHFADFEVDVSYRQKDGSWASIDGQTEIFDKEALYEPGYVQVVYLRVENKGTVPFDFQTAVSVMGYTESINMYGQPFSLMDVLKFGVVEADTLPELEAKVATRDLAKAYATTDLCNYATQVAELAAGGQTYLALVVTMPEFVGNEANYYHGSTIPKVELGIIVEATQKKS